MRRDDILQAIARHSDELKRFDVRALYLFGSVARGEERAGSDIDFEVEFDSTPNFDRYIELKFYLEELLQARVDLLTKSAVRPEIAAYVEKEAIRAA